MWELTLGSQRKRMSEKSSKCEKENLNCSSDKSVLKHTKTVPECQKHLKESKTVETRHEIQLLEVRNALRQMPRCTTPQQKSRDFQLKVTSTTVSPSSCFVHASSNILNRQIIVVNHRSSKSSGMLKCRAVEPSQTVETNQSANSISRNRLNVNLRGQTKLSSRTESNRVESSRRLTGPSRTESNRQTVEPNQATEPSRTESNRRAIETDRVEPSQTIEPNQAPEPSRTESNRQTVEPNRTAKPSRTESNRRSVEPNQAAERSYQNDPLKRQNVNLILFPKIHSFTYNNTFMVSSMNNIISLLQSIAKAPVSLSRSLIKISVYPTTAHFLTMCSCLSFTKPEPELKNLGIQCNPIRGKKESTSGRYTISNNFKHKYKQIYCIYLTVVIVMEINKKSYQFQKILLAYVTVLTLLTFVLKYQFVSYSFSMTNHEHIRCNNLLNTNLIESTPLVSRSDQLKLVASYLRDKQTTSDNFNLISPIEESNKEIYCLKKLLFDTKIKISIKWSWSSFIILCSGDVEKNPGPIREATLLTLNCRGLKNQNKLRQLLNRLYSSHNISKNFVAALQETHLEFSTLSYSWKGSNIFTPGLGHKGGCVTLLGENMRLIESTDIDNEGHVAVVNSIDTNHINTFIIINLHAPCAHDEIKIDFFIKIRMLIDSYQNKYDNTDIILLGDFNTAFSDLDRINTRYTATEINIAERINNIVYDLNLNDCWDKLTGPVMTWRHGKKMSKLDRIRWSDNDDNVTIKVQTDWTYTVSDHCAVVVRIIPKSPRQSQNCITRLDTRFLSDVKSRDAFLKELDLRMQQIDETNLDPHGQLEFLKMSIRSIAIEISSSQKKLREQEFETIKHDLDFWQKSLESAKVVYLKELALSKLDEVIAKRDKYLTDKGDYLSARMNSKWYHESEKSTKYFLNIQRSKSKKTEMLSIFDKYGTLIEDPVLINEQVEDFYKALYEKGDKSKTNRLLLNSFLTNMPKLNKESSDEVCAPLHINELLNTLKTCTDSAPGPDGIPYSIIKLTWKHFGPKLLNSWQHGQITGDLTQSHNSSYLRLLPKDGKDIKHLKNWRPITLSNCDLKIITKCLATKLTSGLSQIISPSQTAYIKGRQITDNLQTIMFSINHALTENTPAMIVSLDAEKAFDSVEHWYLREILRKVGLSNLVSTFDLLYKDQSVNILLNNSEAGIYKIKNGVKQGDALSCALFILGIEPLIRNINEDNRIKGVMLSEIRMTKALAYADDVACIISPTQNNLNRIFEHYEVLTKISGLRLNADKTEIIEFHGQSDYNINHNNNTYHIKAMESIKINGIHLCFNLDLIRKTNFDKMLRQVSNQLMNWSQRNLSLLGKILIFKTFGLSQILYTASCVMFNKSEDSKLNELIYKFIWNKNMDSNKAPDRIKRSILGSKVNALGFGMIDFRNVVKSIRINSILRLLSNSPHPLSIILSTLTSKSTIDIKALTNITPAIDDTIVNINKMWKTFIKLNPEDQRIDLLKIVCNEYVGNVIAPRYKNKRLGIYYKHFKIKEVLDLNPLHPIINKLRQFIIPIIKSNVYLSNTGADPSFKFPVNNQLVGLNKISSKNIRESIQVNEMVTPKLLNNINIKDQTSLGYKISKMSNVKLKSILLRTLHGDIYSGDRLKRFGMIEDDKCIRCGQIETRIHLIHECNYVKSLWAKLGQITNIPYTSINTILGVHDLHDVLTLAIHSDVIRRLLSIDRPVVDQWCLIKSVINRLFICERTISKYQISLMLKEIERIT